MSKLPTLSGYFALAAMLMLGSSCTLPVSTQDEQKSASATVEDDITILSWLSEYKERKQLLEIDAQRELRDLRVVTIRKLKQLRDQFLKEEKVEEAFQASEKIKAFTQGVFRNELMAIKPDAFGARVGVPNGAPYANPSDPFGPPIAAIAPTVPVPAGTTIDSDKALEPVTAVLADYDRSRQAIERSLRGKVQELGRDYKPKLKNLLNQFIAQSRLDEAVMARNALRVIATGAIKVEPDPGYIRATSNDVGKVFVYEVIGSVQGSPYGTDVYTVDTPLAPAAVHAGVLKAGQKGIVQVTILPGQQQYIGSERNGVRSSSWGAYHASYKVEEALEE